MIENAIRELQEIQNALNGWLASNENQADRFTHASLQQVALQVRRAHNLLTRYPADRYKSSEWKQEKANYRNTLDAVKYKLERFATILNIERAQMEQRQARLGAAKSWAKLLRQIS